MNTYKLIVHRPTNHAFRAVYFDGSYECFKEIEIKGLTKKNKQLCQTLKI